MEEHKGDDVYMDIALRIVNIFSKDHPQNPYISQSAAIKVLFPPLGEAAI